MVTSPFDLSDEPDPAARVEATLADAATGLDAAKAYLSATAQTQLDGAAGALGNVRRRIQQMAGAALAESQSLLESTRQALETHAQATLADSLTQAQEVGVDFPPSTPPTDTDLTCGDAYVEGPADATEPPVKAPAPKDVTVNVYCDKPKPAKKKAPTPTTTPEEEVPPEEEPEEEPEPEPKPVKPVPCTRVAFDKDCSPDLLTLIGQREAFLIDRDPAKIAAAYQKLIPRAAEVLDPNLTMEGLQSIVQRLTAPDGNDYVDPTHAPGPTLNLIGFGQNEAG